MKKITLKSLLAILILGTISQSTLQAMDQNSGVQAADHADNSALVPFLRGLNRIAGRQIVDITPRLDQHAALVADENDHDPSTNSVIINMRNDALRLSRTLATNYQARRARLLQQLDLDTVHGRFGYATILAGSYALTFGARNIGVSASRYLNDRSTSDALVVTMLMDYAAMVAAGYLLLNTIYLADMQNAARALPAGQQARTRILLDAVDHEQDTCVICHDNIEPNSGVKLPNCTHIHHPNCIIQWFRTQSNQRTALSCPTCRTQVV